MPSHNHTMGERFPQPNHGTSERAALDALERTYWNLRRLSEGKVVRDLAETFAEAESVLAAAKRLHRA